MHLTNSLLQRILLTAGLSVLAAAISTAAIVGYAESRSNTISRPSLSGPSQQKMSPGDRALTQKIRKSLLADKFLARVSRNIKIVSLNGKVSLVGPVRSAQERTSVDSKAIAIAGATNVSNELTVVPAN